MTSCFQNSHSRIPTRLADWKPVDKQSEGAGRDGSQKHGKRLQLRFVTSCFQHTHLASPLVSQIGSLYTNCLNALADATAVKNMASSSNYSLSTLNACRQQLADAGVDSEAWLQQQVAAQSPTERDIGLQVAGDPED